MITKEEVKNEIDNIPDNLMEDIYNYIKKHFHHSKNTSRRIHTYKLNGQFDDMNIREKAYGKNTS